LTQMSSEIEELGEELRAVKSYLVLCLYYSVSKRPGRYAILIFKE